MASRLHYVQNEDGTIRHIAKNEQPCQRSDCILKGAEGCTKRHHAGKRPENYGRYDCPGFIGKPQPVKKILPRRPGTKPRPVKVKDGEQAKLEGF
jgi:hypothetical protein